MPHTDDYKTRLKKVEDRAFKDKGVYDATLRVRMYPGTSRDHKLTVQASLDFYQHAAMVKLKLLRNLSKAEQIEQVAEYLRSWKTFVSKKEVQAMLKARSRMDKASDSAFATACHPGPDLPRTDAMFLLSGLCSRFLEIVQTPGGRDVYEHRKELIQNYDLYVLEDPPTSPDSSRRLDLQLLSLSSAGDTINTMKVISRWAQGFIHRLHIELLVNHPHPTKEEVVEAFKQGRVPPLPDVQIAVLYEFWTHSNPRTSVGQRFIGLTRVAREYGKLLGFSKDVNDLNALKAEMDSASLSHRSSSKRFVPQARF